MDKWFGLESTFEGMMRVSTICFAFAALNAASPCLAQSKSDFSGDQYLSPGCIDDGDKMCAVSHAEMKAQWPKALKGDYQSQRNVAFCLSNGCDGAVTIDRLTSCTWRIVILASGSGKIVSTDILNYRQACEKSLSDLEFSTARAKAGRLFQEVYRKALPAGPWSP